MKKIASPTELQTELKKLLAYCETHRPRREVLASELMTLATRLSMEHPSEEDKKNYLREHPNADPKNHTTKQDSEGSGKGSPSKDKPYDRREHMAYVSNGRSLERNVKKLFDYLEKVPAESRNPKDIQKHLKDVSSVASKTKDLIQSTQKRFDSLGGDSFKGRKKFLGDRAKDIDEALKSLTKVTHWGPTQTKAIQLLQEGVKKTLHTVADLPH